MKNSKKEQVLGISPVMEIRFNTDHMTVRTKDGKWALRFKVGTKEYAALAYLMSENDRNALTNYVTLMYLTRIVLTDNTALKMFIEMIDKFYKTAQKPTSEDKEDLEEVKSMYEALQMKNKEKENE